VVQGRRRLSAAQALLQMGDLDAAQVELRFAITLLARAVLLRANSYPLSRPELAQQLDGLGVTSLALLMRRLGDPEPMREHELINALALGCEMLSSLSASVGDPAEREPLGPVDSRPYTFRDGTPADDRRDRRGNP